MEDNLKLKYLGALSKNIAKLDDVTFKQRVNETKHEYAEWVLKNIKDDELYKQIAAEKDKGKIISILNDAVNSLQSKLQTGIQQQAAAASMQPSTTQQQPTQQFVQQFQQPTQQQPVQQQTLQPSFSQQQPMQQQIPPEQFSQIKNKMEDNLKLKYLGALSKNIAKLDDVTFKQRVNETKHEYAEWVLKNIKDDELYKQIAAEKDKEKIISILNNAVNSLQSKLQTGIQQQAAAASLVSATTQQVIKNIQDNAQQQSTTLERKIETQQPQEIYKPEQTQIIKSEDIDKKNYFKLNDGSVVKDLNELAQMLPGMNDDVFQHHVNPLKNDFASWIRLSLKNENLANSIDSIKDKNQIANIVSSSINLDKKNYSLETSRIESIAKESQAKSTNLENTASNLTKIKEGVEENAANTTGAPQEKLSPRELFYKLKKSKEEQKAKGISAPKPKSESSEIDLITMSARQILERLKLIDFLDPFIAVEEEELQKKKGVKKLKTGVPGFDEMIDQGIIAGSTILASGGPGSGKTTFCIQMIGWAAEKGEKCLFITLEESEENLIQHMESYGLNPRKYIAEGNLVIQKQDPFKISRSIEALLAHGRGELLINIDEILDIIPPGFKPDRVVIDSLSAISSAFNESSTAYRIYINQLINLLSRTGATSFLISEVQGIENIGHGLVEEFLADGVIVFYNLQKGNIKQSALEILKMRAVNHEKKIVPFEFVEGKGIVVYPLEKVFI